MNTFELISQTLLTRAALARFCGAACLAGLIVAAPVSIGFDGNGLSAVKAVAQAKDGNDDGNDSGDDSSGSSDSGRGSDDRGSDDSSGSSGGDDRSDDGDRSGRRGGDDRSSDDHGRGADDGMTGQVFGRRGSEHVEPRTGSRVEVSGNHIEIVHPNGWKEELENGIYEIKDPQGRTVTERRATSEDLARVHAFAR